MVYGDGSGFSPYVIPRYTTLSDQDGCDLRGPRQSPTPAPAHAMEDTQMAWDNASERPCSVCTGVG